MEEARITIGTPIYLGYQKVTEDDGHSFAQLRMITLIKDILPNAPDPDTGRTYGRVLIPINKVPALLDWGVDGLLQSADAAVAAIEHLGIDLGANREETRLDY
jgi:8-oxo-dGTP diphosphatase